MTEHDDRLRQYGLFNAKVPRFTSYPPANRFSDAVDGGTVQKWLSKTPAGSDISLYIHIPFCRRLCWFCACRTQGTKTDAPLGRYVDSLLAEIGSVRAKLPDDIRVTRLHLGGGTPTILPVALMDRMLGAIDAAFGLGNLQEFSVEIDPVEIDRARLEQLVDYGLNRASIGVQDFDPKVQNAIGRTQSFEITRDTADTLRDLGVEALNLDLLYGLPFQTQGSLDRTLDQVLALNPSRLALYGYAHVPWMSKRQLVIPVEALPGPESRFGLFEHARRRLLGQGFTQIGIDHFGQPQDSLARAMVERRLGRSFQGYTDDLVPRLIGLGASAISRFPEGYAQNQPATKMYQSAALAGLPTTCRGIALTDQDEARAEAIQHLMCYHSVRLAELRTPLREVAAWFAALAAEFPDAIRFDGDTLILERWARPLARIFAARLGETPTAEQTFSAAI